MLPGVKIIGVECVPERLNEAIVTGRVAEGHCCFFHEAHITPNSVDVVYSGEVIEHVSPEEAPSFVEAAFRILRCGGQLILTTPNPNYIRLWLTGRKVTDTPSHLSAWTVGALKDLVGKAGFVVTKVEGTGKVSRRIGTMWPVVPFYGSYMLFAHKPETHLH